MAGAGCRWTKVPAEGDCGRREVRLRGLVEPVEFSSALWVSGLPFSIAMGAPDPEGAPVLGAVPQHGGVRYPLLPPLPPDLVQQHPRRDRQV